MTRQTGAYGRPNTPLLPPQWQEHNGRTSRKWQTARCEIREKDTKGPYDPVSHTYPDVPGALLYRGTCKVQRVNREQVHDIAEQNVTVADYMVSISDVTAEFHVGALVRFTETSDPLLLVKVLPVINVLVGTLAWDRDLFCSDGQG